MTEDKGKKVDVSVDKVTIKNLAMGGLLGGGGECFVDVRDGKAVRIRPYKYDWKTDYQKLNPWKIERNGETLTPLPKALPAPFSLAYKKRTFSPNRVKFPLVRVDWDPDGAPASTGPGGRNAQNRGKSKYRRISWDEATDVIAAEIRRVHQEYGPLAILAQGDGHGENKTIHTPHGHQARLLDMMGGFTQQVRNPDSWEGWYWGAKHVWGQGFQGMMSPAANLIKDISENADLVLKWGCDEETTPWGFTGMYASRISQFWKRAGIKQVYICPDLNYAAAVHADKWIPILPNTDAALQLAIIHVWLTEGTWDKEYVETHAIGMDKVADYVLGRGDDDVAKTPEWASQKCGVSEWTIKALAREFARNTTSIVHYFGGSAFRGPYSHEPGRLECILLGMQGLGGPGVHQCQMTYFGMPRAEGLGSVRFFNPELPERLTKPCWTTVHSWGKQLIPKTLIQDAILKPDPLVFHGAGGQESPVEEQFDRYTYPLEEGGTRVRMIWTDTPCRITCWNHGNSTIEAMRDPSIEFVLAQHPWLENDCLYADMILPANTTLEVEDIVTTVRQGPHFASVSIQEQSIDPVGESRSDYEIVLAIAEKLGLADEFSGGHTTKELQKQVFDAMKMDKLTTWDKFYRDKTYVYATAKDWEEDPPGFRRFYDDPQGNPLPTPSGRLEFYSERLAQHFPDDRERPPSPEWVEKGITHDESLSSQRADLYPLLIVSNHPRWRTHAQGDDISWTRETPTGKVLGFDGYRYEPLWINPVDAEPRGIKNGDVVKIFNERGTVLVGARVWERVMPGVVYVDHGARHDPIVPGKVDRGGAINTITPIGITSKNCCGQATSGYLVDVRKVTGEEWEEWRRDYPEAFARKYEPGAGLRFDAWIDDDGKAGDPKGGDR